MWRELEAETGCSSYVDYLVKFRISSPNLWPFFEFRKHRYDSHVCCTILDLSRNADSTLTITGQDFSSHSHEITNSGHTATKILQALRDPPITACSRVVLWWSDVSEQAFRDLVIVCGLGLRVGPRFFQAIFDRLDGSIHSTAEWPPGF